MSATEELVRRIERSVLDVHHRTQPLLRRPSFEAVGHLLKTYGGLHRDHDNPVFASLPLHTVHQHYITYRLALEWCLRWLIAQCPTGRDRSGEDWKTIDDEVISLFAWGLKYSLLAVAHTAWSRGEMSADVNEATRTISFSVKQRDPAVLFGQATFMSFPGEEFSAGLPHEELESYFRQWRVDFVHECPPVLPDIEITADHPLVRSMVDTSNRFVMPELMDSQDIGGFTIGDFRRLYSVLFVHCYLLARLEDYCDTRYGRGNYLGSSVFQLPRDEMIEYLATQGRINRSKAAAILDLLTFDTSHSGAIAAQPFVQTKCGTVSLLARLFCHLEPSGTLPRALIRRRPKMYGTLINMIERKNVVSIGESLSAHMLQVRTHVRMSDDDGDRIEPDLLAYDPHAMVLLVADYKHSLTPVGPAETANRTSDHTEHVRQVRKYRQFIQKSPSKASRVFGCELFPERIVSMVLYRRPMPIPVATHPDVLVADWTSLQRLITQEPIVDLGKTLDRYAQVSAMLNDKVPWNLQYMETQVGEWLYRHEIYASP